MSWSVQAHFTATRNPTLWDGQGEGVGDQQRRRAQARAASCRSGTWDLEREHLGAIWGSTAPNCVSWGSYFTSCAVRDPSVKRGNSPIGLL